MIVPKRSRASYSSLLAALIAAVLLLSLAACQPSTQGTAEAPPAAFGQDYPTAAELQAEANALAYPAPGGSDAGYPAGPMAMPAIENASRMTARLVEIGPDAELPGFTRLRVLVLAVEEVPGLTSFAHERINQEVDLYIETNALANITVGETFETVVEYRGDEHGGKFFAKNLTKINP